ncbi:MAG: hypothetical protein WKF92_09830 [Pyrinomonadaceae bacterium]
MTVRKTTSDTRTFHSNRRNRTITYETPMELIFLEGSELDASIEKIIRVNQLVGDIDRYQPTLVFPSFVVIRQDGTTLVILLTGSIVTQRMRRQIAAITRTAESKNWVVKTWKAENAEFSRTFRDKKRACA